MLELRESPATAEDVLGTLLAGASQLLALQQCDERPARMLGDHLVELSHLRDLIDLALAHGAARFATTDEYDRQGATSPIHWMRGACHLPSHAAADAICVGEEALRLQASVAALTSGRIGFGHLALLARTARAIRESPTATGEFDEAPLLRKAEWHTISRFRTDCEHARHVADQRAVLEDQVDAVLARRLELSTCGPGGMFLRGWLDPVGGATLRTALEPLAARLGADDDRRRERRIADALVELAAHGLDDELPQADDTGGAVALTGATRSVEASGSTRVTAATDPVSDRVRDDGPGGAPGAVEAAGAIGAAAAAGACRANGSRRRRPHLQVTASLETLLGLDGAPAGELDFARPIAAATVQRIACDASVTRVLLGPDSTVVDVGRARRVPSGATRRALVLRDQGCAWPGCERPAAWTEAHHLRHWANGGATELGNLVLICTRHHWKVHEGGWQLVRAGDGRLLTIPPGGRDGPPPRTRGPGADAA